MIRTLAAACALAVTLVWSPTNAGGNEAFNVNTVRRKGRVLLDDSSGG